MRDALASVVTYNQQFIGGGRDPAWLKAKLDRLCASPFGFLRGTFHLFVEDWPQLGDDPLAPGEPQPIVGDLHLENLGAFKAHDGRYVFDVNDFDETGPGSPALDLGRIATSLVLAGAKHGVGRAATRIEAMVAAWRKAVTELDLRPIDNGTKGLPGAIKDVLEVAEAGSRTEWIDARVEGDGLHRRFKKSEKYFPLEDSMRRAAVDEAVRQFAAGCPERPVDCPSWPNVLDVAVRIAGTGSLGRWRFAVLLSGKGEKVGKELILELKESLPSSLTPAEGSQANRVVSTQRRLQGDSPGYLGTTEIAGIGYTVRELQPMEAKLDSAKLHGGDLDVLAETSGMVVGRMHRRGAPTVAERAAGRDEALARRITAFGLRYADVVEGDWQRLVRERKSVEAALGLT
jgi:uncharacterized protein (DUF2252 family)